MSEKTPDKMPDGYFIKWMVGTSVFVFLFSIFINGKDFFDALLIAAFSGPIIGFFASFLVPFYIDIHLDNFGKNPFFFLLGLLFLLIYLVGSGIFGWV